MIVIKYPLLTEKAAGLIERENKIVFVVEKNAGKADIKKEVERLYAVRVQDVNTMVSMKGIKKAYVKLAPGFNATDLATKLKII